MPGWIKNSTVRLRVASLARGPTSLVAAVLLLLLTAGQAAGQEGRQAVVTATNVQIMAEPSFSAEALAPVAQGTMVRVLEVEGDWARVLHQQRQGFVHTALVSITSGGAADGPPAAERPAAARSGGAAAAEGPPASARPGYVYKGYFGLGPGLIASTGGSAGTFMIAGSVRIRESAFLFDVGYDLPGSGGGVTPILATFGLGYHIPVGQSVSANAAVGLAPSMVISTEQEIENPVSMRAGYLKGGAAWHPTEVTFPVPLRGRTHRMGLALFSEFGIRFALGEGGASTFTRLGVGLSEFAIRN